MATYSSIFSPAAAGGETSASLNAATSTAEIVLSKNFIFAINATGDINIKFGNSGMGAAAATNFRIPSGVVATFDTGDAVDRIRLFNNGTGAITYWILPLSRV